MTFGEAASYLRFIAAVDQKATVYRPWTGLITVDTRLHEGVPVLRVVPGSPAAQAGVQPGEVLYAVDGKPIKQTAELIALVESRKPERQLGLHLRGAAGAAHAWTLALSQTPQEIPLNDPALLYNKVMMDLRQQVEGYPGSEAAAFARPEPGAVRHALRRLRRGPRAPAEGARRAAAAARASRRARRSTTWAWRSSGSATRRRRWTPTGRRPRLQGRHALQQRRARRWRRWPRGARGS